MPKSKKRKRSADGDGDGDAVVDLCSSDSDGGDRPRCSGYKARSAGSGRPLNDTRLRGTHGLITLETARFAIRLVSDFMRDDEAGESVAFARDVFDPLWQRLKDQGGGGGGGGGGSGGGKKKNNSNNCRWRHEPGRDPLGASWVYVPPRSRLGARRGGKLGRDYYSSEEHLVLSVLEDVSVIDEVSGLYAGAVHHFSSIMPVLDRAVTEGIRYRDALREVKRSGGGGGDDGEERGPARGRGGSSRSCKYQGFGVDCALMDDPYELSGDDCSSASDGDDDDDDDGNKDECEVCGGVGELICCDKCDNAYHADCLGVELEDLPDPWHCPSCRESRKKRGRRKGDRPQLKSAPELDPPPGDEGARSCKKGRRKSDELQMKSAPGKSNYGEHDDSDESDKERKMSSTRTNATIVDELKVGSRVYVEWEQHSDLFKATVKKLFLDRDPPMVRVHYDGSKKSIFDDISPDCIKHFIKEEEDMTVPDTPPSDGKLGGDPQCNVDLKGVEPTAGMAVDIRDSDFLWNAARITNVSYEDGDSSKSAHVVVSYSGWPEYWDETLPYPNERLARGCTYTKRARGFLVLPGGKRWPCKVFIRMPHPDPAYNASACDILREDGNIFAKPYMSNLLPSATQQQLVNGGQWVRSNRLRPWKRLDLTDSDDPGFIEAYRRAEAENWLQGLQPPSEYFEEGALLREEYRVHEISGSMVTDDQKETHAQQLVHDGEANHQVTDLQKKLDVKLSATKPSVAPDLQLSQPAPLSKPTAYVAAPVVPALPLPPSIPITDLAYPNGSVRRLPGTNSWVGIAKVAGNDVFLGSFSTQSEATHAAKIASDNTRTENVDRLSSVQYGLSDLFNTPIEAVVSAFEATQSSSDHKPQFRLRDWMAQNYSHLQQRKDIGAHGGVFPLVVKVKNDCGTHRKKRQKSIPKRLIKTPTQHSNASDGLL